jgi:hypothetical protein
MKLFILAQVLYLGCVDRGNIIQRSELFQNSYSAVSAMGVANKPWS